MAICTCPPSPKKMLGQSTIPSHVIPSDLNVVVGGTDKSSRSQPLISLKFQFFAMFRPIVS